MMMNILFTTYKIVKYHSVHYPVPLTYVLCMCKSVTIPVASVLPASAEHFRQEICVLLRLKIQQKWEDVRLSCRWTEYKIRVSERVSSRPASFLNISQELYYIENVQGHPNKLFRKYRFWWHPPFNHTLYLRRWCNSNPTTF